MDEPDAHPVASSSRLMPTRTGQDLPAVATAAPTSAPPSTRSAKGKERAGDPGAAAADKGCMMAASLNVRSDMAVDTESEEDDEQDEMDYERERQARIEKNRLLLDSLGFAALTPAACSSSIFPGRQGRPGFNSQASPAPRKKRLKVAAPVYDRSGHVLSLPRPGEKHVMSCVEIPSDRRLKRRIAEGEYADCMRWAEGESRRWRFGWGRGGPLSQGEEAYVGGIGEGFRWRRWKGLEKELRRELGRRGRMNEADQEGLEEVVVVAVDQAAGQPTEGASAYSLIPGAPCHQCRRKSEKPKMTCRNLAPECRAVFCETCCKRYSYFQFDAEARTFICPLCKNCCNCANCIRKRNLAHLLDGKKGLNVRLLQRAQEGVATAGSEGTGSGGGTMEDILAQAVQGRLGVPFDSVRIVDQDKDVVSPELPPEVVDHPAPLTKKGKGGVKRKTTGGPAGVRKRGRPSKLDLQTTNLEIRDSAIPGDQSPATPPRPLIIKLRIPPPGVVAPALALGAPRTKEVDSDGDTVGGYSSDSSESSLTSLDSWQGQTPNQNANQAISRRLTFPPRTADYHPPAQSPNINDYLSAMARHESVPSPRAGEAGQRIEPRMKEANELLTGAFSAFDYTPFSPVDTGSLGLASGSCSGSGSPASTSRLASARGMPAATSCPNAMILSAAALDSPLDEVLNMGLKASPAASLGLDPSADSPLQQRPAQYPMYDPHHLQPGPPPLPQDMRGGIGRPLSIYPMASSPAPDRTLALPNTRADGRGSVPVPVPHPPVGMPSMDFPGHATGYLPSVPGSFHNINIPWSTPATVPTSISYYGGDQAYDPPPYSHSPPSRLRLRDLAHEPLRPQQADHDAATPSASGFRMSPNVMRSCEGGGMIAEDTVTDCLSMPATEDPPPATLTEGAVWDGFRSRLGLDSSIDKVRTDFDLTERA